MAAMICSRASRPSRASRAVMVTFTLGALLARGDEPPRKYALSLDRHASVGERFKLTCSYKSTEAATFAGDGAPDPWKRLLTARCEGTWTTLAIGKNSKPSKVSLKIGRFTYQEDDGPEQWLTPGRIISAEIKDGKNVFSMDVGEIPESVTQVLNEFMFLSSGASSSADERFGSKEPRGVGQEWPVGAAANAAAFRSIGLSVIEQDFKGSVKLASLRKVDGVECFVIEYDYGAANVIPKAPLADRLDTVGEFRERGTVLLPVDAPKKRVRNTTITEWKRRYTWRREDGSATPVVQTSRVDFDEHCVPLEPAE